jgi:hypothetical protein
MVHLLSRSLRGVAVRLRGVLAAELALSMGLKKRGNLVKTAGRPQISSPSEMSS